MIEAGRMMDLDTARSGPVRRLDNWLLSNSSHVPYGYPMEPSNGPGDGRTKTQQATGNR